jgi:signal transduction histidine kinase
MTSIHDDGPGSSSDAASWRLQRLHEEHDALAGRLDGLEAVLAASCTGWCRLDAGLCVLAANSQLKAEFGYAPDATMSWEELLARVSGDDRGRLDDAVRAAFSAGADVDLTLHVEPPGRPPQSAALRGRVTSAGPGSRPELILTTRNVSEQQNEAAALLARERRAREAAEAANRAKDELLSMISHELRSPMMAIQGWNRILALRCRDEPDVIDITPRIERSVKAQMKIVDDLLDVVRINTGKLRIEPRPMQLAKVARLALELARPTAAARGIEIVARLDGSSGALRGDPDRLQQVIANLVANAIKFTSPSGRITVSLRELERDIELSVEDTGKGIEPALLPHVFDRFLQGDSASARHWGGLGLGLTLVREIVTLHGGVVSAHSEGPGKGATFVVRLPAARACCGDGEAGETALAGAAAQPHRQSLQGLSILVVDDEPEARTVVEETLRLEGAQVTVADSAAGAYGLLQSRSFDVLVTDICMPEEDGYSLVRRMRRLRSAAARTVAIAVTSCAARDAVATAREAGFDAHFAKPLDFDRFLGLLRHLARP